MKTRPSRKLYESFRISNLIEKVPHTQLSSRKESETIAPEPQSNLSTAQPFNTINPHIEWCPSAVCHNSPLCAPCNRRYLIILSHGRSGSTSLLSMFDKLPGVRLSGENYGLLNKAANLIFNLQEHPDLFADDRPETEGAFRHNAIPTGSMSCVVQDLMYTLDPPELDYHSNQKATSSVIGLDENTILGLKTIRLYNPNAWNAQKAAKFLKESFPCARYIVNKRSDVEKTAISYQKAFQWNSPLPELEKFIKEEIDFLEAVAGELGPDAAKVIDLENWKRNVGILNTLLFWLGFHDCSFDAILHDNRDHGYEPDQDREIHVGDHCQAPPY